MKELEEAVEQVQQVVEVVDMEEMVDGVDMTAEVKHYLSKNTFDHIPIVKCKLLSASC